MGADKNEYGSVFEQPTQPLSAPAPAGGVQFQPPAGYEIIGEIARGGMGVVYKATQKMPSRVVALKVMLQGTAASEDERKRFLREADAAAALKHPGIVPIYEVGEHEGKYFFSMEYVDGRPLHQYLRETQVTLHEKLLLFLKIAEAVTHAHIRGIIHRDLKPSNILIEKDGNPRLLDFGLAKLVETGRGEGQSVVTISGKLMGTFAYMSPEQTMGNPDEIDTRSDVYSLGIILYQMLTGTMPYRLDHANPLAIIKTIQETEPRRPSVIVRALRGELETILLKAIAKEKERRYQSAADLARDIRHFLNNEPIEARPSSTVYYVWKMVQRHKAGTAALAVFVLGFLVAFVWINHLRSQASAERNRAERAAQAEAAQRKLAEQERDKAIRERYIAQIGLAENRIEERAFALAEDFLATCPTDLRHWEWGRLLLLCRREPVTLKTPPRWVRSLAFSPDGKRVACSGGDGTIRLFETDSGRELRRFAAHPGEVECVLFAPDGAHILSGGGESGKVGVLTLWDAGTGKEVMSLRGHSDSVCAIAFSPEGRRIASGSRNGSVNIWEIATGRELASLKGHAGEVAAVAFSPDGKRAVSGSRDKSLKVWEVETRRELMTLKGHSEGICSVAFISGGRRIISVGYDHTVRIWDAGNGRELRSLEVQSRGMESIAFTPDGKRGASAGSDGILKVWDTESGQELMVLREHSGEICSLAFSPDGQHVASRVTDGTVRIWSLTAKTEPVRLKGHTAPVYSVAFSPDGRRIASGSYDRTVKVWDAGAGRELMTLKGHSCEVVSVAFSPDGKRIASAGRIRQGQPEGVRIWNAQTGQEQRLCREDCEATGLAFCSNGRRVVVGHPNGTVSVLDADTGAGLATLKGSSAPVTSVACSPNGTQIAAGSAQGSVKIWDAGTGRELLDLRASGPVYSLAYSPEGGRLASGGGYIAQAVSSVWDTESGREVVTLKGHSDIIFTVAFSPDGKRIASGSLDGTVKIWDSETGEEVLSLKGHSGWVFSAAFSPDGKRIASGSADGTIILWQAADWKTAR
jgi:WD40 repeat protein/predicted Ser/Thr protein kinase